MEAVMISSQWYVVRYEDGTKTRFAVLDGPYPEEHQAVSAARLREIDFP